MAKQKGNTIKDLNVGSLIRNTMLQQRMTHATMARKLSRHQSTVKNIIYQSSMQTYLVWELSIALNHNFFADLAQQLDAATNGEIDRQTTELEQLKTEYNRLKEERDYLRKAVDLLTQKQP